MPFKVIEVTTFGNNGKPVCDFLLVNNNNNNNNLCLIMVKTNCSILHKVYNIQQSAMQGSNDTTHSDTDCHAGQQRHDTAQRV